MGRVRSEMGPRRAAGHVDTSSPALSRDRGEQRANFAGEAAVSMVPPSEEAPKTADSRWAFNAIPNSELMSFRKTETNYFGSASTRWGNSLSNFPGSPFPRFGASRKPRAVRGPEQCGLGSGPRHKGPWPTHSWSAEYLSRQHSKTLIWWAVRVSISPLWDSKVPGLSTVSLCLAARRCRQGFAQCLGA